MDVVEQMMPGLKDYPLYPYLEYRQITDDLMNQPAAVTVTTTVRANPRFLPLARCNLVSSMNWRGVKTGVACWPFSPEKPGTTEAQCNYYYAKWNTGQSEEAWQGAKRAVANRQEPA